MSGPIELAKKHPVAIVGGVIAVFVVVLLVSSSGGSNASTGSSVAAPDQSASLAYAQLQSQQQAAAYQTSAAKDVALAGQQSQLKLAEIDAQTKAAEIAAGLVLGSKTLDNQSQANTLSANVAGQQIKANSQATAEQYATLSAQIKSQGDIAMASINAQTAIATKPKNCGLLGFVFGC